MRIECSRFIALVAILGLAVVPHLSLAQDNFVVIAHVSSGADSLAAQVISDFFLKKTSTWPDGRAVTPVDQWTRAPVRGKFTLAVHGQPSGAIMAYWARATFGEGLTRPSELQTSDEVVAYVRITPGAIGYVDPGTDTTGVKVISVQ